METKKLNENTEYEKLAQYVYQCILNAEGFENITVQHNVQLDGKSGCKHQIDVYWEFTIGGITQKVAIECKNYNDTVSIGKVRDFYGVLHDVGNITGIFVTKIGYQSGAKLYADYYGIEIKEIRYPEEKDWAGLIKTIQVNFQIVNTLVKEWKIEPDFIWLKNNNLYTKEQCSIEIAIEGINNEIYIFDEKGNIITNFYELGNKLPWKEIENKSDIDYSVEYESAFIDTKNLGRIKINKIGMIYDIVTEANEPLIIDADAITKAIIKDVKSGKIKFVTKKGEIK